MRRAATAPVGLLLVWALALMPAVAAAQSAITFQYVYDQSGQLIKVIDSTGIVIEYVYDAVGNMLEVRRSNVDPTQLTIVDFTPGQGGPGTFVTIRGLGFSGQPGGNVVMFNGVPATVLSATPAMIVASVPVTATSGFIAIQVAANSVTSAIPFSVLAVPFITSVTPRAIDVTRAPPSITVTGGNLAGTSFDARPSIVPPPVKFGTPQINGSGTSAVVPVTVSTNGTGAFVVVATSVVGNSETIATSGNTITLISGQSDVDTDGDGYPDGLELIYGSDPFDSSSKPDLSLIGDVTSAAVTVNNTTLPITPGTVFSVTSASVTVNNTTLPVTSQSVVSPAVSIENLQTTTSKVTPNPKGGADSLANAANANAVTPGLSLTGIPSGRRLIEGETVVIGATLEGSGGTERVRFAVNGVVLAEDSAPPYALTFTVPSGAAELTFGASTDATLTHGPLSAAVVTVAVNHDVGTTVSGRVVDQTGNALANAKVELLSDGLHAEIFDFLEPLGVLPDLAAATPTRSTRVTAVNMRSPASVFGLDPLGTGLAPDYAARITGQIAVPASGIYTFFLGADEGARLRIGGVTIIDMASPAAAGFQESSGAVELAAGVVPIEITFYESTGTAELQLSMAVPGGAREVVLPTALVPSPGPWAALTDANGRFTLTEVPMVLRNLRVVVTPDGAAEAVIIPVATEAPLPTPQVDLGVLAIPIQQKLLEKK